MRIGIGCTTYKRPEVLEKWKYQVMNHTPMDNVFIFITDDTKDRKGVAFRKNECLRALKDCDYVFMFDDDCFPIKDGWMDFFINGAKGEHLLFMNTELHRYVRKNGNCFEFADCGGVFMFLTKEHIKTV